MADKILGVQTITVTQTHKKIEIPQLWDPTKGNLGQWGQGLWASGSQYWTSDRVVYLFDEYTGSFELTQDEVSSAGVKIYPTLNNQTLSGPWRLIAEPPRFLVNSGSNSTSVRVTTILIR